MERLERWRDGCEAARRALRSRDAGAADPEGIAALRSWAWEGLDRIAYVDYRVEKPKHELGGSVEATTGRVVFTLGGFRADGARVERAARTLVTERRTPADRHVWLAFERASGTASRPPPASTRPPRRRARRAAPRSAVEARQRGVLGEPPAGQRGRDDGDGNEGLTHRRGWYRERDGRSSRCAADFLPVRCHSRPDRSYPAREMTDLTILGGGPAGLGVAYYAHRAGLPFVLFEGSSELGGMCRTLRCGEHLYDRGAHRLHDPDPEITRDLVELMGDELIRVEAASAIGTAGATSPSPHAAQRHLRLRPARGRADLPGSGALRAAPALSRGELRGLRGPALRQDPGAADPSELFRQAVGASDRPAVAGRRHPPAPGDDAALPVLRARLSGREGRARGRQLSVSPRWLRADSRCARPPRCPPSRSAPASRSPPWSARTAP